MHKNRHGFTLIELLVVMGIMAALMIAAGPMWNGLTRSSGMKGATMQLRTTLSLARQWAITHRETTYVVFPKDTAVDGKGQTSRVLRAYNVYTASDGFVRDWIYLPEGVVFDDKTNIVAATGSVQLNVLNSSYPTVSIKYPTSSDSPKNMCAITFRSDGSTTGTGDIYRQPLVVLTEGYLDENGVVQMRPTRNSTILQVSSMAGQIKVTEK